nr:uncharacterized protein LOC113737123 isoform X2 [Coffea arabica]
MAKQLSDMGSRLFQELKLAQFSVQVERWDQKNQFVFLHTIVCGTNKDRRISEADTCIRNGRFLSAKSMVSKLNKLKLSLKWEHITKIAGTGVAPERLHVARALVEAGHVENLKQAFSRYLYDGGSAYSTSGTSLGAKIPGCRDQKANKSRLAWNRLLQK